jgi:hypothetical protein
MNNPIGSIKYKAQKKEKTQYKIANPGCKQKLAASKNTIAKIVVNSPFEN